MSAAAEVGPETLRQARTWEQVKANGVDFGLCVACAAQLAWGAQLGFGMTTRQPCPLCRPLVASFPVGKPNGWRVPAGRLTSRLVWMLKPATGSAAAPMSEPASAGSESELTRSGPIAANGYASAAQ